ncbi:MAG: alpha/beta hydrolase [Planctomycetes bacterium]|nr:alpha/beta hydrolase [Planctomycetota bacterium]
MMNPPSEADASFWTWVRSALYIVLVYVGIVAMLLFFENWLVFQPTKAAQHWQPPPSPDIEDVELAAADGARIHAWWCPAKDSDPAILYCHGNAGNLSHRGNSIVKLRQKLNASVLIVDYPGYGKSEGAPTEQGCYSAADAGYDWLLSKKKFPPTKIILYGGSLGGGVVTDLASRKDHRALVLIKTFSSLPDVASDLYWWLPAPKSWLMSNRFESIQKIGSIRRPVFIAHGTADALIPFEHGKRLFAAANEPKCFYEMPGHDHNMPLPDAMFTALDEFLSKHSAN